MKNILLVKGKTAYDAGGNYIEEWAAAMRRLGCNTYVLDGWSLAQPMLCAHVFSSYKFDAVFDCNGSSMSYEALENLPSAVIHGIYMHDHPGGLERIKRVDDRTIVFNCDRRFCKYIDQYLPMVEHRDFIPLSGSFYPKSKPYRRRGIDIIFTGSYIDPEKQKAAAFAVFKEEKMEAFGEAIMNDIVANPQYTLPECLTRMLNNYDRHLSDYEFNEWVRKHLLVDYYVRSYYRDKMLRTLLDSGLEIHVFGNGWGALQSEYRDRLVVHKGGAYAARKAVANAKIALNIMPWFKEGFQERIATAMLSKAVAVTDDSEYISESFTDGKELVVYSLENMEALAERIKYLLANPKEAEAIAENGYQRAVQAHTWQHRVYHMLQKIEEDFGVSFIQESEGRELQPEIGYPDRQTMVLDAVYELNRIIELIEYDMSAMNVISGIELEYLRNRFIQFKTQFEELLSGIKENVYIWNLMNQQGVNIPKYTIELFSMQCRAWMGRLLSDMGGLNL